MRLRQFSEGAMEDTVRIIQKTFSPERKAVSDKILEIVRAVQMGKGDKMELARAITDITKSELEAKNSDPDLKVSTTQNLGMLKRAMDTVTGMSESITEEEIEEYKSIANLRNDSMFRSMAKLQDRKKPKEPEIKKVEPPQQLDLFKEDEKENAIQMRKHIADIRFDVAEIEDKISQLSEKDNGDLTDQIVTMMRYSQGLYSVLSRAMKIVPVYEATVTTRTGAGGNVTTVGGKEIARSTPKIGGAQTTQYADGSIKTVSNTTGPGGTNIQKTQVAGIGQKQGVTNAKITKGNTAVNLNFDGSSNKIDPNKATSAGMQYKVKADKIKTAGNMNPFEQDSSIADKNIFTEEEFDEAAGEKDACYHKVKARYKVWPSAYASGALVKCRKVGAANWGNSKKK